jgi:hypothetical protein
MKFSVTTKVFDTIQNKADLEREVRVVKEQIQKIMNSGSSVHGGQFAHARGHSF